MQQVEEKKLDLGKFIGDYLDKPFRTTKTTTISCRSRNAADVLMHNSPSAGSSAHLPSIRGTR